MTPIVWMTISPDEQDADLCTVAGYMLLVHIANMSPMFTSKDPKQYSWICYIRVILRVILTNLLETNWS